MRQTARLRRMAVAQERPPGNPAKFIGHAHARERADWVIWSSEQAHSVDALAAEGDEGRGSLR